MSDKKKIIDKSVPDSVPNTPNASEDEDTASIIFASSTTVQSKSNFENLAFTGAPSAEQSKTSSSRKSNLPSGTKTNNVPSKQTPNPNSVNIKDLPDIPWPDDQNVICSVLELYKDYVDQSDPFLEPPLKMPPREVQMPDPKLPRLPKQGGFCQNFAKLDAELKKLKEKMQAQEKDTEIKDKDDTSEGGNDDSQKSDKTE